MFGTPDETRSTSFWYSFLNELHDDYYCFLFLFRFVNYTTAIECVTNGLMDESSSRFRIPKTFNEEKECVINSIPKSTVYKNKLALQIFRE